MKRFIVKKYSERLPKIFRIYNTIEEEDRKWQLAKARQISRDIENSVEYFFNKDTDSKTLKRLLRELDTIIDYVVVCLFKEEK